MQRGKAAVRVGVKQAVGALCRLLTAAGLDAVPNPETFRRAKVSGGAELEDQFWQLLANILQTTGIILCESGSQLQASEHRKLVAAGLWQTGYHADWIYGREEREGGETGAVSSRDLLLALGWLLAVGTLEKLLTLRATQLDQTLLTPTLVNPKISAEVLLDSTSLRKLQWLIGSVRLHGRTLLSMQAERARLLHAVFSACLPSSASSGSINQSSTVLRQDYVRIRELCVLLETYLNWKQVEQDFWLWMDSVVDCHLAEPAIQNPTCTAGRTTAPCHHGNRGIENLEDMLSALPTAQGARGSSGGDAEERRQRGGERWQGELDASSFSSFLPSVRLLSRPYRVRLQAERRNTHSTHTAEGLRRESELPEELPASEAIQELAQTEAWLLERRGRRRRANRMQLQELIGRLDQLVLLPPESY